MSREEMEALAEPEGFRPFVIRTVSGKEYQVPHPEFISIPPGEETSYVEVYELTPSRRHSVGRWVPLSNIDAIEFANP
jgi:hypothetical protein